MDPYFELAVLVSGVEWYWGLCVKVRWERRSCRMDRFHWMWPLLGVVQSLWIALLEDRQVVDERRKTYPSHLYRLERRVVRI